MAIQPKTILYLQIWIFLIVTNGLAEKGSYLPGQRQRPNECFPGSKQPCCKGWTQNFREGPCVKPLCNPPCVGGVCIGPNLCLCRDGEKRPSCSAGIAVAAHQRRCVGRGCLRQRSPDVRVKASDSLTPTGLLSRISSNLERTSRPSISPNANRHFRNIDYNSHQNPAFPDRVSQVKFEQQMKFNHNKVVLDQDNVQHDDTNFRSYQNCDPVRGCLTVSLHRKSGEHDDGRVKELSSLDENRQGLKYSSSTSPKIVVPTRTNDDDGGMMLRRGSSRRHPEVNHVIAGDRKNDESDVSQHLYPINQMAKGLSFIGSFREERFNYRTPDVGGLSSSYIVNPREHGSNYRGSKNEGLSPPLGKVTTTATEVPNTLLEHISSSPEINSELSADFIVNPYDLRPAVRSGFGQPEYDLQPLFPQSFLSPHPNLKPDHEDVTLTRTGVESTQNRRDIVRVPELPQPPGRLGCFFRPSCAPSVDRENGQPDVYISSPCVSVDCLESFQLPVSDTGFEHHKTSQEGPGQPSVSYFDLSDRNDLPDSIIETSYSCLDDVNCTFRDDTPKPCTNIGCVSRPFQKLGCPSGNCLCPHDYEEIDSLILGRRWCDRMIKR